MEQQKISKFHHFPIIREAVDLNKLNGRIIDNAPISIMVLDKNGIITFVNKFFRHVSRVKNPVGKSIYEMPFFIREKLKKRYARLLKDGKGFKKENCPSLDKASYISIIAVPMKDADDRLDGALSMALETTEAVVAKMKLREMNEGLKQKIAKKTKQLEDVNQKLKKSLDLRAQFISDASHELRTPLTIAKLNLEFLQRNEPCNDNLIKNLRLVDNEISKVSDIISDLSLITAIDEKSRQKLNFQKLDLNSAIDGAIKRLSVFSEEKNMSVLYKKSNPPVFLKGDKKNIEKMLLNIIRNSIKYGRKDGWIKISVRKDKDNFVKIKISDNGIGIPKDDLPHIFSRFFRSEQSKKLGEGGFGLGLAICKWIIEQHKGHIKAESKLGEGSVFTVSIPCSPGQKNILMYN